MFLPNGNVINNQFEIISEEVIQFFRGKKGKKI